MGHLYVSSNVYLLTDPRTSFALIGLSADDEEKSLLSVTMSLHAVSLLELPSAFLDFKSFPYRIASPPVLRAAFHNCGFQVFREMTVFAFYQSGGLKLLVILCFTDFKEVIPSQFHDAFCSTKKIFTSGTVNFGAMLMPSLNSSH